MPAFLALLDSPTVWLTKSNKGIGRVGRYAGFCPLTGDDHLSRVAVTDNLKQPTRVLNRADLCALYLVLLQVRFT